MKRIAITLLSIGLVGCCIQRGPECTFDDRCSEGPCIGPSQLQIGEPNCDPCCESGPVHAISPPNNSEDVSYVNMSLEETIRLALENSEVLRDLGGTVLRSPLAIRTANDPAIIFSDPRFGEEAALSQFDATFSGRAIWDNNDRRFNNRAIGSNGLLQQDLGNYEMQLQKRSATGTLMSLRHVTDYDFNNTSANLFGNPSSSWTTFVDATVRHPLMQGGGIDFNRIAGPSNQPGVINGILIARIQTDVSLADVEIGLREFISNVENAYWDLYFAYRDLQAKKRARDNALRSWQVAKNAEREGGIDGTADKLGQAEEQYWRFQAEVLDSLNGRLIQGTQTNNGSTGGTFRGASGVRLAERRLRLIMGMPMDGQSLLRPSDEPTIAPVQFDWQTVEHQSLAQRPEIRRQRWVVKQRELELLANKNFLLPQVDALARYRFRGFGQSLIDDNNQQQASAVHDLFNGDHQEWQLGVEFSMPIGFRQAHAAVRNSKLQIARECAVLEEQKRHVVYGITNAVGETNRAYEVLQAQYNRRLAADKQVNVITELNNAGKAPFDLVLEAQRRLVDAEVGYYRARVDYSIAIKNVHFEKGTLLEYCNIDFSEGRSSRAAYADAADLQNIRGGLNNYVCRNLVIGQPVERTQDVMAVEVVPDANPAPSPAEPVTLKSLPEANETAL